MTAVQWVAVGVAVWVIGSVPLAFAVAAWMARTGGRK